MWIDATSAGLVRVRPEAVDGRRQGRLHASSRTRTASTTTATGSGRGTSRSRPRSKNADAAKTFIEWATSKDYTELVAAKEGWANAPPGTRTSLYENQNYLDAAPFADETKAAMNAADITKPTVQPVPYTGGQFVAIPEFQSIGTTVGQLFSAVIAGQSSVDDALAQAQSATEREMRRAGY